MSTATTVTPEKVAQFIRVAKQNNTGYKPRDIMAEFGLDVDTALKLRTDANDLLKKESETEKPTPPAKVPEVSTPAEIAQPEQSVTQAAKESVTVENTAELKLQNAREDVVRRRNEGATFTAHGVAKQYGITIEEAVQIMRLPEPDTDEEEPNEVEPTINNSYPTELASLVASGVAYFQYDQWFANRCAKCGRFDNCGHNESTAVTLVRLDEKTLTGYGRQATGLDPIKTPKPPKTMEQIAEDRKQHWSEELWWKQFRGAGELEGSGDVKMYIENFLCEGITLISGMPKEGKSFLALSVAKALTTGKPLFGRPGFEVPEIIPVLFLAAESGDGALKLRCKKFGITEDKTLFIARTLSQGPMFGLDDPSIEQVIKAMRPVVILETLIRFNDGEDEDSASDNNELAAALFRLVSFGARAVIGIHHSRKDIDKSNPTKQQAVRGSSDALAMPDCVWLVMQDDKLYQGGRGPNEIEVVGWGRDFVPTPMRLALTKKTDILPPGVQYFSPGIISCLDTGGDFEWVDRQAVVIKRQDFTKILDQLITGAPTITLPMLAEGTGHSEWEVRKALKRLGYHRPTGGKKGETEWKKKPEKAGS